jgi:hypothetical protein
VSINETDDLIVPGGFAEFLENPGRVSSLVIGDRYGHEMFLDEFNERFVGKDLGTKIPAPCSSRNFLKKKEHGLP